MDNQPGQIPPGKLKKIIKECKQSIRKRKEVIAEKYNQLKASAQKSQLVQGVPLAEVNSETLIEAENDSAQKGSFNPSDAELFVFCTLLKPLSELWRTGKGSLLSAKTKERVAYRTDLWATVRFPMERIFHKEYTEKYCLDLKQRLYERSRCTGGTFYHDAGYLHGRFPQATYGAELVESSDREKYNCNLFLEHTSCENKDMAKVKQVPLKVDVIVNNVMSEWNVVIDLLYHGAPPHLHYHNVETDGETWFRDKVEQCFMDANWM